MPDINFSVGTNAVNMAHDTALVEALLTVVRRSNGRGYMGQYDGRVDTVTRTFLGLTVASTGSFLVELRKAGV